MYPTLGEINNIPIVSYYVFNSLGIIAGFIVLFLSMKNLDSKKRWLTIFFAFLIFVPFILGARLGHIIESQLAGVPESISKNFLMGPFSLLWGLGISALFAIPIARILKVNVWETADLFAFSISIGGVFARIACLLNGCCFGIQAPDNYGFAVFYPYGSRVVELFGDKPIYPAPLFELLAWLFIFVLLLFRNKYKTFQGELIIMLGFIYAFFRFIIEFYRYHETPGFPSEAQVLSLIIIVCSIIVWLIRKQISKTQ